MIHEEYNVQIKAVKRIFRPVVLAGMEKTTSPQIADAIMCYYTRITYSQGSEPVKKSRLV
jgi:hypothetical protein